MNASTPPPTSQPGSLQGLVRNPVERPILFNGAMVRAILSDRKTQTRRVMNPQPRPDSRCKNRMLWERPPNFVMWTHGIHDGPNLYSPYGATGDRLWVRETFAPVGGAPKTLEFPSKLFPGEMQYSVAYRASLHGTQCADFKPADGWKPSIFMPRYWSRITLEVIAVRVERLQSMARTEARDEGCGTEEVPWKATGRTGHGWTDTYAELWDSINLKRGFGWDSNPWVWVIDFARISNDQGRATSGAEKRP